MSAKPNPAPGFTKHPEHRIEIEPFDGSVTVTHSGNVLASTREALVLREANYPPVFYIPFKDVKFESLARSGTASVCPFKGDASYWDAGGVSDVMWAYEHPYDEVIAIKDHGAFYPNKVRIEAGS